jgi:hypothetical protein
MDEPTSVELAKCARQAHSEAEKLADLDGLANKVIEGFTSAVLDTEHRAPSFAHKFHGPQRPRSVKVVLKFVFVGETIDALKRPMLGAAEAGYESVPVALGIVAPQSAKDTIGVLPQHL